MSFLNISAPCVDCPRKGCGAYHDQCPEFQQYKADVKRVRDRMFEEGEQDAVARHRLNRKYRQLDGSAIKTHRRREEKHE